MPATQPVQRISSQRVGLILAALLETYTGPRSSRREYVQAVLSTFAFAVGERSANPASLTEIPGDVGLYTELDYAVIAWSEAAAKQLDELLDSLL
jgi:hypothetical protein